MDLEDKLIKKVKSLKNVASGLGDDAFFLREKKLVISTDSFCESIHFEFPLYNMKILAAKTLRSALSDVVAKAAKPQYLLLNLSMPSKHKYFNYEKFLHELDNEMGKFEIQIIGGDTTAADSLSLSLTIIGEASQIHQCPVHQIEGNEFIYYLGTIGGPFCARTQRAKFDSSLLIPDLKIDWLDDLMSFDFIKGATDVSDGLIINLRKLIGPNWGAAITESKLPLTSSNDTILQLNGGEDQGILFVAKKEIESKLRFAQSIGQIHSEQDFYLIKKDNKKIKLSEENSFKHFG